MLGLLKLGDPKQYAPCRRVVDLLLRADGRVRVANSAKEWACVGEVAKRAQGAAEARGQTGEQLMVEDLREDYNRHRPHRALGTKTPAGYAVLTAHERVDHRGLGPWAPTRWLTAAWRII